MTRWQAAVFVLCSAPWHAPADDARHAATLSLSADDAPPPAVASLVEELTEMQHVHQVSAMGLVLFSDGKPILISGYGTANRDTPFRWGSISKSFTALGALHLAHEQNLALTTPVAPLLSQKYFDNPWSRTDPVQLIHLLELSAGFSDLSGREFDDNEPLPLSAALARGAVERVLLWPPGWQHGYTNVAPGITAAVIESLSGQSFEQYMTDAVLHPLGMSNAGFLPVPGLPGGFRPDGTTPIPYWHMTFRAFGALNASVAEMANFLDVLLNGGRLQGRQVFAPASIERMHTPSSSLGARAGLTLTYAAGMYPWVREGHAIWGHGGDADGYRSRYGLLLDAGRGYLLVINTDNPGLLRRMQRRIEQWMLSELPEVQSPGVVGLADIQKADIQKADIQKADIQKADIQRADIQKADPQQYAGTYYPSAARFGITGWMVGEATRIRLEATDQGLLVVDKTETTRLYPAGEGRFRRSGDPAATVIFIEIDDLLLMQGELGSYVNLSRTPCPAFLNLCPQE